MALARTSLKTPSMMSPSDMGWRGKGPVRALPPFGPEPIGESGAGPWPQAGALCDHAGSGADQPPGGAPQPVAGRSDGGPAGP